MSTSCWHIKKTTDRRFTKFKGKREMNQTQENFEDQKTKIISEIAELSKLLGMIPSNGAIKIHEPLTQNTMVLADWLSVTRGTFLKLSLLISKELDIQLQ